MGISRDSLHKRRATGGRRQVHRKKRKFELGRPAANTRVSKPYLLVDSSTVLMMITMRVNLATMLSIN